MRNIRLMLCMLAAVALVYFVAGATLLRFALPSLVLPREVVSTHVPPVLRIGDDDGSAMLVRRYGTPRLGCVVFFPGQHGLVSAYEDRLFPAFTVQGIAVLAVAYPGQDGAPGKASPAEILKLAVRAVVAASSACPDHRVVVYGRSFGSMVAAYAAAGAHPSGLILESAAPSSSSAIYLRLKRRWYLVPLAWLPVSKLLPHDYSLAEALADIPRMPAVVFQGDRDSETPLSTLQQTGIPLGLKLVVVPGGEHSTTDFVARDQIVCTALSMLDAQAN